MTTRLMALAALLLFSFGFANSLSAATVMTSMESSAGAYAVVVAQGSWPEYPSMGGAHDIIRGPGGYLSWIKLLLIAVVFFVWVRLMDWINRDAIKFGEHTNMPADIVNPLVMLTFIGGFIGVLSIPSFFAGYPVYVVAAFLPYTIYMLQRRGQIPEGAHTGELFSENYAEKTEVPIQLTAAGANDDASQSNMIRARQSPQFEKACQVLHEAVVGGTDQILFDFTREAVAHRMQVDGMWHPLPPMDRETGDGVLFVLKTLAGLNVADRRSTQKGMIKAKHEREKMSFDMTTQGVQTGERVLIRLTRESKLKLELPELGMNPDMQEKLLEKVASAGTVIISAPPGQGLTSTWQGVLNASDRFTRDFVGIADPSDRETERENIEIQRINIAAGESPVELLKKMLLKQPSTFVFPVIPDSGTMDILTDQVNSDNRTLITRVQAGSAAEAALRLMSVAGNRAGFAKSLSAVTNQRLVRRLCDECKKPVQANPKAIQQMGGNPAVTTVLYKDYQLPPVEQRVNEAGKQVEMEPCKQCNGIGFRGRVAIFELMIFDAKLREVITKTPNVDAVSKAALQLGNLNLMQQAYRTVLDGKTSLAEIQRVFQPRKQ